MQTCRSMMDLGHRNINFGQVVKGERREKMIVVKNLSEVPLLYRIRKSLTVAAGDLHLSEGRMGVVRPFGKREVPFVFDPTLSIKFCEKLIVENVHDRSDTHNITVKAMILRSTNFYIRSADLDFGPLLINDQSMRAPQLTVTNTSKQTRYEL